MHAAHPKHSSSCHSSDVEAGALSEGDRRRYHSRSTKEKRLPRGAAHGSQSGCAGPRGSGRGLALGALIGTLLGTIALFRMLPAGSPTQLRSDATAGHTQAQHANAALHPGVSRVLHLSLAGTERKARFGLASDIDWEGFLWGVQDRLHVASVARVETGTGLAIRSLEDLMHRDQIVVFSDEPLTGAQPLQSRGPRAEGFHERAAPPVVLAAPRVAASREQASTTAAEEAEAEVEAAAARQAEKERAEAARAASEAASEAAQAAEQEAAAESAREAEEVEATRRAAAAQAEAEAEAEATAARQAEMERTEAARAASEAASEAAQAAEQEAAAESAREAEEAEATRRAAAAQAEAEAAAARAAQQHAAAEAEAEAAAGRVRAASEAEAAREAERGEAEAAHAQPTDEVVAIAPIGDATEVAAADTGSGAKSPPAVEAGGAAAAPAVAAWGTEEVVRFFGEVLRLPQYVEAIKANEVTGAMLLELIDDTQALDELGITSRLHISKVRTTLKSHPPAVRT